MERIVKYCKLCSCVNLETASYCSGCFNKLENEHLTSNIFLLEEQFNQLLASAEIVEKLENGKKYYIYNKIYSVFKAKKSEDPNNKGSMGIMLEFIGLN